MKVMKVMKFIALGFAETRAPSELFKIYRLKFILSKPYTLNHKQREALPSNFRNLHNLITS